jgi:hypothetical protein
MHAHFAYLDLPRFDPREGAMAGMHRAGWL